MNNDPIMALLNEGIDQGVYPGASLLLAKEGQIFFRGSVGHAALVPEERPVREDTLWDIASLTKPVVTVTACLFLAKAGQIDLKAERVYDEFMLWDLLHHVSGLPAWQPFSLRIPPMIRGRDAVKAWLKTEILATPLQKRGETCYSDLGFILLGIYLEEKLGLDLDIFFTERIAKPFGLSNTGYRPLAKGIPVDRIAATRKSKRRGVIVGEVDDDNGFVLDGVSGHTGLFSSVDDLHTFFLKMHEMLAPLGKERPAYGRFHYGWDTPTATRPSAIASQAGSYFGPQTIGHLGFTGTSMWFDLKTGWEVIFLTNRVHPDPKNEKIKRFRPYLHDEVAKLYRT